MKNEEHTKNSVKELKVLLAEKNRELEIEAALDKVRTRMLKMKSSSELEETTFILTQNLKSLGIVPEGASVYIVIINSKTHSANQWIVNDESVIIPQGEVNTPLDEHPLLIKTYEDWKNKKPFLIRELEGDELLEFLNYFKTLPSFKDIKVDPQQLGERMIWSEASFSRGTLGLIHDTPLPQTSQEILIKFSKVLDLTYQRFLDLQKAEEQAREAQIEAALERIRNRTLLMKNSKELNEAVAVFFNEFKNLNLLPPEARTYFCDINTNNNTAEVWMTETDGKVMKGSHFTPLNKSASLKKYYEAWRNKLPISERVYTGKILKDYLDFVSTLPHVKKDKDYQKIFKSPPKKLIMTDANFLQGNIGIMTFEKLSREAHTVLKRFAKVFEFTYTRFLDLQNAEAQAREAQIEAALEKVRSRSLAMYKSDELQNVVSVVFEQLQKLDFALDGAAFIAIPVKNFKGFDFWMEDKITKPACFRLPYYDAPSINDIYDALESGKDFISNIYGKEKNIWFEYAFEHSDLKIVPEDRKKWVIEQDYLTQAFAVQKNSALGIHVHHKKNITENEIDILKRFSQVFEQGYVRFLDLQKAEAQAREAQVEAALEKVRSRSLAMQTAKELGDVVKVIVEKLLELDVVLDANGVVLCTYFEDSKDVLHWISSPDFSFTGSYLLPYFDHVIFNDAWNSKVSGESYFSKSYSAEEKNSFWEYAFEYSDYRNFPADFKQWVFQNDKHSLSFAWQKNSAILIPSHTGIVPSEIDINILKRFAKVFEQAYVRFMDLKTAEAQTREAQIEAALERIRSRAIGMQNSKELIEVANVLREQMALLGQQQLATIAIHLYDLNPENFESWYASVQPGDKSKKLLTGKTVFSKTITAAAREMIKMYHSHKKEYTLTWEGEKLIEWMKEIFQKMPGLKKAVGGIIPAQQISHYCEFAGGALVMVSLEEPPSEESKILQKRTAAVFGLAYRRFLDLKNAEAQAKEAKKQATLERVRGEIASMRSTEDLNQITPLIWKELNELQVPFIRCGVLIMDNQREIVQTHLSAPDGKALGIFELPYESEEIERGALIHWQKKEIFLDYWDKKRFKQFMQNLLKAGRISTPESFTGDTEPPENLHLNFVPFKQGMLYVGNETPLSNDALELVKALAETFSIAFARYEDFQHLDEAKNQIEKALNDLKSAQNQLIHSEKMASLGELTAGIAHEIQNPLNFVNNFSEVSTDLIKEMIEELENGNTAEVIKISSDIIDNLHKINEHGKRASSIVKGMLEHSRAGDSEKQFVNINKLADEYLHLAYHGFRAKNKSFNADFKTSFDPDLPKMKVMGQDMGRVLLNIFNNAFYAVSKKSSNNVENYNPLIIVTTKNINNILEIRIKDNGPGIPKNILNKIFQPFFTTKPSGLGTGLGLSLSYDIITKGHKGTLTVETKENSGTEFIIKLPIE